MRWLMLAWMAGVLGTGCAAPSRVVRPRPDAPRVRQLAGDALPMLGPDARVDRGLRAAAQELASLATRPDARLTPGAVRLALGRAGYPGDARFVRVIGGTEVPQPLLDAMPRGVPLDAGWAWRDLPDGGRWWVLGWAPRPATLDPVPRDLPLDGAFGLRVEGVTDARVLVSSPAGRVEERDLPSGVARWLDVFHEPGEHRVEVVDGARVALLFSVWVDASPPPPAPLPGPAAVDAPMQAEGWLLSELQDLRARAGLRPLTSFPAFVPHARAHATCLASAGVVAHATPHCPGVTELARRTHFPLARHREDVAAADTAAEAWERVRNSPGHLQNLLCTDCTHVSIGAAQTASRLFVTWELLDFPQGEPRANPAR
ncbi:MAG: hypothetical protein RLZZ299_1355 [Pseudomonadota bacterium]